MKLAVNTKVHDDPVRASGLPPTITFPDLHGKKDDSGESDPAVERVHVGDRCGRGQIVGVEGGFESDGGQQESSHHNDRVHEFQLLLGLVTQQAVD